MFYKVFLLFFYFVLSEAAFEGDRCVQDDNPGVCTNLKSCQSALQDLKNKGRNPQICGFNKTEPIVCCLDSGPLTKTLASSQPSKPGPVTLLAPVNPDSDEDEEEDECADVPTSLTAQKTGQKAFDKCIEYQEQLVYPCEKGVSLLGELSRSNYCHHTADELIVGGNDASRFEFPHMVMLGYGKELVGAEWLCGGSLISDRFILTAGHCIATRDTAVSFVLVGALWRNETSDNSKVYKVKNIIKHPKYNSPSKYHDIALLELEKPVKLDQFTVPACVHTGEAVNDTEVLATGWGNTNNASSSLILSETLQKVKLIKYSTGLCSNRYKPYRLLKSGFDEQTQTCYGDLEVTRDTCPGDSGGPIQIKNRKINCMYTVVGVTSFGRACGFRDEPGIYTRVANYVSWIEGIIWPN